MGSSLDKITIKGFKSIKLLEDFKLKKLNVLIGGNGVGKSNFIGLFRLLRAMMKLTLPDLTSSSLKAYIADNGGSDDFLFQGPSVTDKIEIEMLLGVNGYRFQLAPTTDEKFLINHESQMFSGGNSGWWDLGSGNSSPELLYEKGRPGYLGAKNIGFYIYEAISSWKIYHFHNTGKNARMRRSETMNDSNYLRFDGSNIAPFLLHLKNNESHVYQEIVNTVRLVAPFFSDFILKPDSNDKVRLVWTQQGSDYPLKPNHLSDGTMRFICLATALLQPDPPSTIIIDEPELGLHPYAIEILAELIQAAAARMQVIISTQSPALVDCFEPEDVIVVNRKAGASDFQRLDSTNLKLWLENYSLGELWRKNVITGGPSYE